MHRIDEYESESDDEPQDRAAAPELLPTPPTAVAAAAGLPAAQAGVAPARSESTPEIRPLFAMTDDSSNPPSHLPAVLVQEDSGAYLEKRVAEEEQLGEAVKVTLSLVCTSTYRDGVVHTCDTFEPSLPI